MSQLTAYSAGGTAVPVRPAQQLRSSAADALKAEIEQTFGRRIIVHGDCLRLSEEIYFKTSLSINANTLRRFFGLVKSHYLPSTSTMNILARYCGFGSLDEVTSRRAASAQTSGVPEESGVLHYLISLFKNTYVKDSQDETYRSLVRHTVNYLNDHPGLADKFQRAIARTKNGQEFYFEQFVNLDRLSDYYGDGLRYYLNEKKGADAQIFGYSLLCLRDWLRDDLASMKRSFEGLKRQVLSKDTHPFIAGRFFASHLLYAEANNLPTERILMDAHNLHSSLKPSRDQFKMFPCFEYVFAQALILGRHYEEAQYYIRYAAENYTEQHSAIDHGFFLNFQLMKAICLCRTGKKEAAEKVFAGIRPSQFDFLSRKLDTLLYLHLAGCLRRRSAGMDAQLKNLVQETGFVLLRQREV